MKASATVKEQDREKSCVSLTPETWQWLRKRKEEIGIPHSRTIEHAVRLYREELEADETQR